MPARRRGARRRLFRPVPRFVCVPCRYFYATLLLGTPQRQFAVIVDTGSTITYVPCASCGRNCGPHHKARASRAYCAFSFPPVFKLLMQSLLNRVVHKSSPDWTPVPRRTWPLTQRAPRPRSSCHAVAKSACAGGQRVAAQRSTSARISAPTVWRLPCQRSLLPQNTLWQHHTAAAVFPM